MVAPGLLRAEDQGQTQPPAAGPQHPDNAAQPQSDGAHQSDTGTKDKGATGWTGGSREQNKTDANVGSRAITGSDDRAADQPEMATGLDLKGPPMRFAPADTPE